MMEMKREQRRLVGAATDAAVTLQERLNDVLKSREVRNTRQRVMRAVDDLSKSDALKMAAQKLQEARGQLARSDRLRRSRWDLRQTAADVKESDAVQMAAMNLEEAAQRISKSETLREAEYHLRHAADELARSKTAEKAQQHLRQAADDLGRTRLAKGAGATIDEAGAVLLASEAGKIAIRSYERMTSHKQRPSRAFWLVLLSVPFTALVAFVVKTGKQGELGLPKVGDRMRGDLGDKARRTGGELKTTAGRAGRIAAETAHDLSSQTRSAQLDSTLTAGGTEEHMGMGRGHDVSHANDLSSIETDERPGLLSSAAGHNLPVEENVPATPAPAMPHGADDLEIIEGIGPRIAGVLNAAGITTLRQLQESNPDHLHEILREAGIWGADPATWAEQARLVRTGNQKNLEELQKQLRGGQQAE